MFEVPLITDKRLISKHWEGRIESWVKSWRVEDSVLGEELIGKQS